MKAKLERDQRIRRSFLRDELNMIVRKTTLQTLPLSRTVRQVISFQSSLSLQGSRFRVHNYCIMTARSRSYIRFFRISRIKLRELALRGALFGIQKASW